MPEPEEMDAVETEEFADEFADDLSDETLDRDGWRSAKALCCLNTIR